MNEILQKTYDTLEARGWCQGLHQNQQGQVCLEGAFALATGASHAIYINMAAPGVQEAWTLLCATVLTETGITAPHAWNDDPATSVEDVKLVLKKAISAT